MLWAANYLKFAARKAPGLPNPHRFGKTEHLPKHEPLAFVRQFHKAHKAGPHYDIRLGKDKMYSWATKKELPKPGGKPTMLFQQPLHTKEYNEFQGTIPSGYGAGTVTTAEKGQAAVLEATPDKIKLVTLHKGEPEYFSLIRQSGPRAEGTAREKHTQGGSWLMVNTTPTDPEKLLGGKPSETGLEKLKFKSVPTKDVDKLITGAYHFQEKVDGASNLFHLFKDHINAISYRTSTSGRPIVHTHRVFGLGGAKTKNLPPELEGSILRGETYGEREGKAIPPQDIGGLLNSSVGRSLEQQRSKNIRVKHMLYDVARLGDKPAGPMGAEERQKALQSILPYLPEDKFHLPQTAKTEEEKRKLFENITSGKNPRTTEGIVAWPEEPGRPVKVKQRPEADVFIKSIIPGEGKLKGTAAGGFEYATSPEGSIVGRVGTGFSAETRTQMHKHPEEFVGRVARITSQGKFPRSGSHRAPGFISLHQDYPLLAKKSASLKWATSYINKQELFCQK